MDSETSQARPPAAAISTPSAIPSAILGVAMAGVIWLSNILVQHPVGGALGGVILADWLTWGAFTFPIAFLITDTTNRLLGVQSATKVVAVGFAVGVILSILGGDVRIGVASGTAFLVAQFLDVAIFDKLRRGVWWQAPVVSSFIASAIDTALFFTIAFYGADLPWVQWAVGDFAAKLIMIAALLLPFKLLVSLYPAHLRTV